jgi:hypothetical protein
MKQMREPNAIFAIREDVTATNCGSFAKVRHGDVLLVTLLQHQLNRHEARYRSGELEGVLPEERWSVSLRRCIHLCPARREPRNLIRPQAILALGSQGKCLSSCACRR